MSGVGFEFMPGGLVRPLQATDDLEQGIAPAIPKPPVNPMPPSEARQAVQNRDGQPSPKRDQAKTTSADGVASPGDLLKQARARIKWLRSEMKRMGKLKRELSELERLVKAAKEKPASNLRTIKRAV